MPLPGIDLTERELGPLHSATLPQRHDLDPYLPIGIRFGTFLFFPEVETGGIFTDNALGTRTDAHSDKAIEVSPDLRLVSDWAGISSAPSSMPTAAGMRISPSRTTRTIRLCSRVASM